MTAAEQAEMERLVGLIQTEQDYVKFAELIVQLNALLARKEQRINGVPKKQA